MHSSKNKSFKIYPGSNSIFSGSRNSKRTRYLSKRRFVYQSLKNVQWYEPPQLSGPVQFFENTGLHGLQYIGQPKRHICERIFWLAAFVSAMVLTTILILHMWNDYTDMPIITVFNPEDKKINQIPFPSVTICSVSKVKMQMQEYYRLNAIRGIRGEVSNETKLQMFASVYDVYKICHATGTFTDKFRNMTLLEPEIHNGMEEAWGQYTHLLDIVGTLESASQSCEDMILYCLWLDGVKNCSKLFHQIHTDFGYCCVFNMIPLSLLWNIRNDSTDNPEYLKAWEDSNINYDNILLDTSGLSRKYPLRQFFPGRSAGLSILLDPHMDDYFCTSTDSNGFVVGLNIPIDYPRMKDNGIAVRTSTESFVSVTPEITMSDESARRFGVEKRHCYFEGEMELKHFTKYTSSNCVDECISRITLQECGCVRYYMPHDEELNEKRCHHWEYNCTEIVREKILEGVMRSACSECLPTCTEIHYNSETTSLRIWEPRVLELLEQNKDKHDNYEDLKRRAKDVSIVHVYFNMDSVFPRLRKEMTTTIDLISNAGGLLGLCMGFSALSLLEIVYHGTLRIFCNWYHKRTEEREKRAQTAVISSDCVIQFEKKEPFVSGEKDISENGKTFMLPFSFQSSIDEDFKKAYFASLK